MKSPPSFRGYKRPDLHQRVGPQYVLNLQVRGRAAWLPRAQYFNGPRPHSSLIPLPLAFM